MALPLDVDGTWVNSGASYDAGELRRADAALFASAGISNGLTVTVDGSDVVTIQPGNAVISGEDAVIGTGVYRAGIGSAVTGSLSARNATNARIDLVVFRQLDTDVVGSHTARTSRIEIIAGTPSATPAVPVRPSMAVELARITVPASGGGAASVNSSQRVYAVTVGPTAPKFASGTVTLTSTGGATASATVSFPAGLFSTAPTVHMTPQTGAGSTTTANWWVSSITTSSFVANMTRSTSVATLFGWSATGA